MRVPNHSYNKTGHILIIVGRPNINESILLAMGDPRQYLRSQLSILRQHKSMFVCVCVCVLVLYVFVCMCACCCFLYVCTICAISLAVVTYSPKLHETIVVVFWQCYLQLDLTFTKLKCKYPVLLQYAAV